MSRLPKYHHIGALSATNKHGLVLTESTGAPKWVDVHLDTGEFRHKHILTLTIQQRHDLIAALQAFDDDETEAR